jgi:hypothetical protein
MEYLLYAACALHVCGALLLYICGAFAPPLRASWKKPAYITACCAVIAMSAYALLQSHFLLLAGEAVLVCLCFFAFDRTPDKRRVR